MLDLNPLLDAVDLVQLAERAGAHLRKTGERWVGRCPLHGGDNDSAFNIYLDDDGKQRWHCFTGCQAGGDAFDFCARWQGLTDFTDQLKYLANYAHISLEQLGWSPQAAAQHQRQVHVHDLLTRAARFFEKQLWGDDPAAQQALAYA